jgi:hypothetical protein
MRRKRPAHTKHTETFEDCTVTVQGNKVWMSGPLADELAEVACQAGVTCQQAFQACIRIGLPLVVPTHKATRSGR